MMSSSSSLELVFIDSRVQESALLLQGLSPAAQVVHLEAGSNGLAQMAACLAAKPGASAVHVLAHGSAGGLWLGNSYLDRAALDAHAQDLAAIGAALTEDGDILFYACDLAAGSAGREFVGTLAALTGTDVAASSDRSGAGGDWQLEITTGNIEAPTVFSQQALAAYPLGLATITVTSNADSGQGSLRDAIARAHSGDTITFRSGMTIALSSGQLSINKNLTIDGDLDDDGTADVTIDANSTSRVLSIGAGKTVGIDGLILTDGFLSGDGGATNAPIQPVNGPGAGNGNNALGAAIDNAGTLTITNSTITGNRAAGGGGGGGLYHPVPLGFGQNAGTGGGGGGGIAGLTAGGSGGANYFGNWANAGSAALGTGGNGANRLVFQYGYGDGYGGSQRSGGMGGGTSGGASGVFAALGGAGGTANNGVISIGGGGGGSGYSWNGGQGGAAVGGIYNTGTLTIIGSTITNNLGAGGGGGGGSPGGRSPGSGGAGGVGVGAIWNQGGTVTLDLGTHAAMLGNAGGGGGGGVGNAGNGASGSTSASWLTTGGGSTTVSVPAPGTPALDAASDSGLSSTDKNTSDSTPTVIGTAYPDATVTLYDTDGTTVLGTATAAGGNWSITSSALSEGTHKLTARADVSGMTSTASAGLAITIDTTAPNAPGTPDLNAASDSGSSSTDNNTSDTTPTLSGTADSGSTVTLYDTDGTTVLGSATATGGNWSITSSALSEGAHALTAKASDAAGNQGAGSSCLSLNVDTTAPTNSIATVSFSADTGSSASDFITKTAAQTISGTTSANLLAGEIVQVSIDNGSTWSTATTSVGANTWSLGTTLAASNTLRARVTDTAGNVGTTASQAYVLDTSAASPSTPDLQAASDSGASNSDNITSHTTPTLAGTAESGSTVTLYDTGGTTVLGTATAWGGNWSITSSALGQGTHTLTARARDAAGNTSPASLGLSLTIDSASASVSGVTASAANGVYKAGDLIAIQVNFSENVYVTGTPQLTLETGPSDRVINYASGSGSSTLTFNYTVQAGDASSDLDYLSTTALGLNGGAIRDAAGNDATLTLASPGAAKSLGASKAIAIDGVAPTVTGVTSPTPNGSYEVGQTLVIQVNFSENVTVTGTPTLTLETGSSDAVAHYANGSGSSTLAFNYTIHAGQTNADLDYVSTAALAPAGGSIKDAAGNKATLTLPAPGGANSLGANKALQANVNDLPRGAVAITGLATQRQQLHADTTGLSDPDGLGPFSYHWLRDGNPISLAVGANYTLAQADVGTLVSVRVDYTDHKGTHETATSAATSAVANLNDAPTGRALITGTPAIAGQVFADTSHLADLDGLGTLSYQWLRAGQAISNATSQTYTITLEDLSGLSVRVSYVDGQGTAENVTSASIHPHGSSANEVLTGTAGNDTLNGGGGQDTMIGGAGDDTYYVDNRHDAIVENPGEGVDSVFSSVSFTLPNAVENLALTGLRGSRAIGNALDNHIVGNAATNRLTGGVGADTLTGGLGMDSFEWKAVEESPASAGDWDVVTDFDFAAGDRIVLRQIDADAVLAGNQAFHFIGTAEFSSTAATGELRFDPGTQMLYGSVDSDAAAEFAVELTGVTSLTAKAFSL